MRNLIATLLHGLTTFCVGVALLAAGYAHASMPQGEHHPDLAQYLAIGGTLADICGMEGEEQPTPPDCEACRIADSLVMLRNNVSVPQAQIREFHVRRAVARRIAETRKPDPARLVRAPPQA